MSVTLLRWATLVALAMPQLGWSQDPPKEPRAMKAREDLYGDPLPQGAVARLGTIRFRHAGAVHEVAFSQDGKLLAASSDDRKMVVIWDRATGRKLREILLTKHILPPTHLRFSPDGKRLHGSVWYGKDMRLYVWDVETGTEPKELARPPAKARALGYSPDARELFFLHNQAEVVRWDIEKGKELGRYPKPEGYFGAVARVGERLLLPQFDGQSVGMWDAAQKLQLWSVKANRHVNYPVLPMVFSADGKLFAVETPARVISVRDSVSGKIVRRFEGDVPQIYYSLAISPDARTIAGSCWDGTLRLWDLESGKERIKIPAIQGWVTHVFFTPDSKAFATGGGNNAHAVLLWDTVTGNQIEPFPGHTSPVSSVSFAPDGQTMATSSWLRGDSVVRLWDPRNGRPLRSLEVQNGGGVFAVAFSPDGNSLAACLWSGDKKVRVWDVRTGRERHALSGHGHQAGCTSVAYSPDGKRLATGDNEGRLCIWNMEAGKLIREILGTREASQRRLLFTRDGRYLLAAADGVHVYDADNGQIICEPFQSKSEIESLALSGDGRLLATADGGSVRLWELATRREIPLTVPDGKSSGVDLTADGRTLVTRDPNGDIVLFHWPTGQIVGKLTDDAGIGAQYFFSPDGRRLATTLHPDSSAVIWDVASLVNTGLPASAKPANSDMHGWWSDLRDDNPAAAYKAIWRFVAGPDQALPFLAESFRPIKTPDPAMVARLIDELDNTQFQTRTRASRELFELGEGVVGALRKSLDSGITVEKARRIEQLLAKLVGPMPSPEQLRAIRAVVVLEQIGSPEARQVLQRVAGGASGARQTQEAMAAMERLNRNGK